MLTRKLPLIVLMMLFISSVGFSQQVNDVVRRYSTAKTTVTKSRFYILQLEENVPQLLHNKIQSAAQRVFTENLFIVDNSILKEDIAGSKYIKQLMPANDYWKLSTALERLKDDVEFDQHTIHTFNILFAQKSFGQKFLVDHPAVNNKAVIFNDQQILTLHADFSQVNSWFLHNDNILFIHIDLAKPKEELATPGFDLSANKINVVHKNYPSVDGAGQHVSIKEDYYDTADIDLKGRFLPSSNASANVSNHANFIATIIAGGGNSVYYAKGAAWAANISSVSFQSLFPDADSTYQHKNITVQNHSYGTASENEYGLNAVAYDKSAGANPGLLHVFSSGNIGTSASTIGNYAGINGFANVTGNFKMAKNVLIVGAVDSFGMVAPLSSRGPAYDGRIKPDLVAFQQNGTSEAAALVSGTALLLQQYYKQLHQQSILPAALARAILINSADDVDAPGPDFRTGFGNLNASKAMSHLKDNHVFAGLVAQGNVQSFTISVPAGVALLKVTLAWNDTASTPLVNKALVNDLDLELTDASENITWKPWVLNSSANLDSLNKGSVRKRDSLNNVEQVTITNPAAGNYRIKTTGYNLPAGLQNFYIAYSWDSADYFKWEHPLKLSVVEAGKSKILHWQNTFSGNGTLEFNYPGTSLWQLVNATTDLQKGHYYWNVPDTISQTMLRMKIGNAYFYSDTFLITTLLKPTTGVICGDSILIYWNKAKNVNSYQVYKLGSKYMEPLQVVTDTFTFISKNLLSNPYLAVAPIVNGIVAQKSYAFNYNNQGAGCYINSFYVDQNGSTATLNLLMGTLANVAEIDFEVNTGNSYTQFNKATPVLNQLTYSSDYGPLKQGISYFRIKIILNGGQVIYTNPEAVFYTTPGNYVLFPMPVKAGNELSLLASLPDGEEISLLDEMGRLVLTQVIQSSRQVIKTSHLPAGIYFYRITKNGSKLAAGKVLIL